MIKPNKGRLVIRADEVSEKIGSIIVPSASKEKSRTGKVLAVASDVKDVKKGDRVIFNPYSALEFQDSSNVDNVELLILKVEEVYGTLNNASY